MVISTLSLLQTSAQFLSIESGVAEFREGWAAVAARLRLPARELFTHEDRDLFWRNIDRFAIGEHRFIRAIIESAEQQRRSQSYESISFPELLWKLSNSPRGRALCTSALQNLRPSQVAEAIHSKVSLSAPVRGLIPLMLCDRLSGDDPTSLLNSIPANLINDFWNYRLCPRNLANLQLPSDLRAQETISLLTLNVWGVTGLTREGSARFKAIGEALASSSYDVVALQEMWDPRTVQILECAGYPYVTTSPYYPRLAGRGGLVILSRHPIGDSLWQPFKNYGGIERTVNKGVLLARLQLPSGTDLVVANTHLVSPPERMSNILLTTAGTKIVRNLQIAEVKEAVDYFAGRDTPVITMGDFNSPENSPEYQHAHSLLGHDIFRARIPLNVGAPYSTPERLGATFDPTRNPLSSGRHPHRLDYIFYRGDPSADLAADVSLFGDGAQKKWSDHFGVSALISFLPRRPENQERAL